MTRGLRGSTILGNGAAAVHLRLAGWLVAMALCGSSSAMAARPLESVLQSLDGPWSVLVDPGDVGLSSGWVEILTVGGVPDDAPSPRRRTYVPGPLEAHNALAFYDGVAWYSRTFVVPSSVPEGLQLALRFTQVNYACRVWIDGVEVGRHEGGYDAFVLPLAEPLTVGERHAIVVRVLDIGSVLTDGLTLATTPHAKESWYHNFGGILGSVTLVGQGGPQATIEGLFADGEREELVVELVVDQGVWSQGGPGGHRSMNGSRSLNGPPSVTCRVELLPLRSDWPVPGSAEIVATWPPDDPSSEQRVVSRTFTIPMGGARRWSPDEPWVHRLVVELRDEHGQLLSRATRTFGFRTPRLDGNGFHLDDERLVLKGVLYQPHDTGHAGMPPSDEELEAEVRAMREAGFNMVRAHVRPAWPVFLDACDRHGLLVIEEPAIGWVADDPGLGPRLEHEVDWMVRRDRHHPSIVIWGLLNELSGKAYRYGTELALRMARADPSRPVLVDSGGFFGASYVPAGGEALVEMVDEHLYPPCPLPPDELREMRTLAATDGPTFVSEYGYGALLDTQAAARGFLERSIVGAERILFDGMADVSRRAREAADGWAPEGWVSRSGQIHADMSARMTEALRSNPAVDLLCYTQWRAVSHEASAGLAAPWGERRPAFQAMQLALRPLLLSVFPRRSSVRAGDELQLDVVVVNDTGSVVVGELVLQGWGAVADGAADTSAATGTTVATGTAGTTELFVARGPWPAGVSVHQATLSTTPVATPTVKTSAAREVVVRALLRGRPKDVSRPVSVVVVAPPGPTEELLLVVPDGDERALAFAAREGFDVVGSFAEAGLRSAVALIGRPEELGQRLRLDQRLELWRSVWFGGTAVLILNPLPPSDVMGLAGRVRGTRTLLHVPVRLGLASSAGNFLGRLHVVLERAWPRGPAVPDPLMLGQRNSLGSRALDLDDTLLTPTTLIVGDRHSDARVGAVTLGHFGQRLGDTLVEVPYGQGRLLLVGLPVLETIEGLSDPRRDRVLTHLLREAGARAVRGATAGAFPAADLGPAFGTLPSDAELATRIEHALGRAGQVVDFWDRHSAVFGGEAGALKRPAELWEALERQHEGLLAFARGDRTSGTERMTMAYEALWSDDMAALLALDEAVLAPVAELLERGEYEDLDLAYQALELWRNGLQHWSSGDRKVGLSWLGSARLLLEESGRIVGAGH